MDADAMRAGMGLRLQITSKTDLCKRPGHCWSRWMRAVGDGEDDDADVLDGAESDGRARRGSTGGDVRWAGLGGVRACCVLVWRRCCQRERTVKSEEQGQARERRGRKKEREIELEVAWSE